jgi:lysophospholipase L1-like esterase
VTDNKSKEEGKKRRGAFILKAAFSALIFSVSLEVVLQAAHFAVVTFRPPPSLKHPGAPVILCVGDSHTYGVLVPIEDSYPSQLQAQLDRRGIPANVINDGIPGQNSSMLRQRLPEILDYYNPSIVIILSSANNDWNKNDIILSDLEDGVLEPGLHTLCLRVVYGLLGSLRTARLAAYTWNVLGRSHLPMEQVEDHQGRVYFHNARFGTDDWDSYRVISDRSQRDLTRNIDLARKHGAAAVLMNYAGQPSAPFTLGNDIISNVARVRSAPLVDNDARIRSLFWKEDGTVDLEERNRLFLGGPEETHLQGPGYALVAENVFNAIMENGLLEAPVEVPSRPDPSSPGSNK